MDFQYRGSTHPERTTPGNSFRAERMDKIQGRLDAHPNMGADRRSHLESVLERIQGKMGGAHPGPGMTPVSRGMMPPMARPIAGIRPEGPGMGIGGFEQRQIDQQMPRPSIDPGAMGGMMRPMQLPNQAPGGMGGAGQMIGALGGAMGGARPMPLPNFSPMGVGLMNRQPASPFGRMY